MKKIKHNDLTHYFLRDHKELPASYIKSCKKFFLLTYLQIKGGGFNCSASYGHNCYLLCRHLKCCKMLIENIQRLDWKKIASLEPNFLGKDYIKECFRNNTIKLV